MLFSQDIGIDLGTANTLVFVKGKGIVIREPSVVAVDVSAYPQKVVAVGDKAKQMIGRTPGSITAVRPLKDGVIADFEITSDMLKEFIRMAINKSPFSKARVLICIPSGVTEVERRAVHDAAKSAGARSRPPAPTSPRPSQTWPPPSPAPTTSASPPKAPRTMSPSSPRYSTP